MSLAVFGPLLIFLSLWVVSVQIARMTPEEELPPLAGPIGSDPFPEREHYLYLTVMAHGDDGETPVVGAEVEVTRTAMAQEEAEVFTSTTDNAGMATFTLRKRGELEVRAPGFLPAGTSDGAVYRLESLARHPDEFLEVIFRRPQGGRQ